MYGQNLLVLLTTSSGSEGINLKFVRQVHILEPYWNRVRIDQVIGRARRIESHILLPPDQQNVAVFGDLLDLVINFNYFFYSCHWQSRGCDGDGGGER